MLPDAAELLDDHFMHVVWGRQLLYGRWFVQDRAALGMPLQSAISAASEWVVGYRLLSEGLITAAAFAAGAAMTFVLTRRVSGSTSIGVAAAAFYYQLGELRANDGSRVRVLARKDRAPSGIDQKLGWPCFADQP